MKNLYFSEYFKNFLYDLDNYITISENNFHIFNYQTLIKVSDQEIVVLINEKKVTIQGLNFKIKQMTKQELLINGVITKVEFNYEK